MHARCRTPMIWLAKTKEFICFAVAGGGPTRAARRLEVPCARSFGVSDGASG